MNKKFIFSIALFASLCSSIAHAAPGAELDDQLAQLAAKVDSAQPKQPTTWDDYGCKPDDPAFDNGPAISKMLADQATRKLKTCPVGTLADYYVKTTINWPAWQGCNLEGSGGYTFAWSIPNVGVTRIVWNGDKGGTVVDYSGSGGRISKLQICGGPLGDNDYPIVAGNGVAVEAIEKNCSGNLVTDQLSIVQCVNGLHYLATPDADHADLQKHFALLIHHCDFPYVVDCDQSCPHFLYACDIREGYKTAFTFNRGGGLHVYGCYLGGSTDATLLNIGRSNDYVGDYEIHGLQVDGAAKNITLLSHGQFAFRVRIDGHVGRASQLADPFVVMREGSVGCFADVAIDCRNAQYTFKGQH